uniref:MYND-type domain-containing protein n=1 Tax=Entomoneis paludosa TaxID=265537 RepID=A0A7S2Y1W0_9STRA
MRQTYDDQADPGDHSEQWETTAHFREVKAAVTRPLRSEASARAIRYATEAETAFGKEHYREAADLYCDAFCEFTLVNPEEKWHAKRWDIFCHYGNIFTRQLIKPNTDDMTTLERVKCNKKEAKLLRIHAAETRAFLLGHYYKDPYDAADEYKEALELSQRITQGERDQQVLSCMSLSNEQEGLTTLLDKVRMRFVGDVVDENIRRIQAALLEIEQDDEWNVQDKYRTKKKSSSSDRRARDGSSSSLSSSNHMPSKKTSSTQKSNGGGSSRGSLHDFSDRSAAYSDHVSESFAPMPTTKNYTAAATANMKPTKKQPRPKLNPQDLPQLSRKQMDRLLSPPGKECDACGKTLEQLRMHQLFQCSKCQLASYCSEKCQQRQWIQHDGYCRKEHVIKKGDFMQIHSVTSKPTWNGQICKVLGPAPRGRFQVVRVTLPDTPLDAADSISMSATKLRRLRPLK